MPIAPRTITLGPGALEFGDELQDITVSQQVTACTLTPNANIGDSIPVLSGDSAPGDFNETWTLDGTVLQDFGHSNSFFDYCFAHRGEQVPFKFVPNNQLERQVTGVVTIKSLAVGGDVKSKPTSDFSFPLIGDPVFGAYEGNESA